MRTKLFFILLIPFFFSCEDELDIVLSQKEKRIVINSFFNDEEFIHVNISSTQPSTDADTVFYIDDAQVFLYEDDILKDTLTLKDNGNYYSRKLIPKTNVSYKLKVEAPDMPTATSSTTQIPFAVKEILLDTSTYIDNINNREFRHVNLKFKDIENTKNYYLLYMIWEATRYVYDSNNNIIDSVKTKVAYGRGEGMNIPHSGKLLFKDEFLEGDTIEKDLYFRKNMYASGLGEFDNLWGYFKLCTVSEEYYLYGKSYFDQHNSLDFSMFVEPVTVFSNINNGKGIFAGYGQCVDSVFYAE